MNVTCPVCGQDFTSSQEFVRHHSENFSDGKHHKIKVRGHGPTAIEPDEAIDIQHDHDDK